MYSSKLKFHPCDCSSVKLRFVVWLCMRARTLKRSLSACMCVQYIHSLLMRVHCDVPAAAAAAAAARLLSCERSFWALVCGRRTHHSARYYGTSWGGRQFFCVLLRERREPQAFALAPTLTLTLSAPHSPPCCVRSYRRLRSTRTTSR